MLDRHAYFAYFIQVETVVFDWLRHPLLVRNSNKNSYCFLCFGGSMLMVVRKSITAIMFLTVAIAAANASAQAILIDDFNSYTGRQTDSGYFNVDPGYAASGWADYYVHDNPQDPAIIVDVNGPHPSTGKSPSGYDNTLGISNLNGNAPGHGHSFAIPGGAVPANSTVRLWAHANLSNNTNAGGGIGGNSHLFIGSDSLASANAVPWEETIMQALLKGGASGGLGIGGGGAQPSGLLDWTAGSSDTDADGWLQVMLEVEVGGDGFMSVGTAYHRPATGGGWIQSASIGASAPPAQATHFGIQMSRDVTFDNVMYEIVPEPASLSMLALGSSLILLIRRRKNG